MSSKRHIRRKQCEGKRQHASAAEAQAEAVRLRRSVRGFLHVYRCQFCGQYHVGHPTRNKRTRREHFVL